MRKRIYHPPSREVVDQYVRKVCERLAERDIAYLSPPVLSGFARFMRVAADIVTKQLNDQSDTVEDEKALANSEQ